MESLTPRPELENSPDPFADMPNRTQLLNWYAASFAILSTHSAGRPSSSGKAAPTSQPMRRPTQAADHGQDVLLLR
jgi:hypothetical protein